ncbi:diacylglycerol kinase [Streptomyces physcomitrii]|uniref:Diacylglycerol kinase n=1 Tax=Streptomyces physcomitrii TaxID=2724184 RepID=A0ABX1H117_9ACTN|nr:diacylglycerol kinase [Streptomyces physcomitrii]NKI41703.1 diacylglycerol kinase [Streptomyces physcomitrii]
MRGRTEVAVFDQLLVVVDPAARRSDGESVRIAKDVLGAGADTKVCLPQGPEEFARALARRGHRRPVVVGDDRALLRAVGVLHRERELGSCALGLVPVGGLLSLTRLLGVPTSAVAAARAVLDGGEHRLDLLVDDSDGVVLGDLHIPPLTGGRAAPDTAGSPAGGSHSLLRTCQSLVRTLARPARTAAPVREPARLRVEADGVLLVDLDQPVRAMSLAPEADGLARIELHPAQDGGEAVRTTARTVTVSGPDFRYRADAHTAGPVRTRTWTALAGAWSLTLPGPAPAGSGAEQAPA